MKILQSLKQHECYSKSWWFLKGKITFGLGFFPCWKNGGFIIWENGGRQKNECLDINFQIWKFNGYITFWGLPTTSLKYIPIPKNKRGFSLGWYAEGSD